MITLRKLVSLKGGTRGRKYVRLLRYFEEEISAGGGASLDHVYLKGLLGVIAGDEALDAEVRGKAGLTAFHLWNERTPAEDEILRACNGLRHTLMASLNMEPGDWDLMERPGEESESEPSTLPVYLYLEDIRSPFNVGAIFRTAEAMGVREIFLSPDAASPRHPRAVRSAMGAVDMVPWRVLPLDDLNMSCFALELGGEAPDTFDFPRGGVECCAIIGSEELGVTPRAMAMAEESLGRVSLNMRGRKGSLNVSVATGILLYQWTERIL
ncbi:MAG: TrmH family RNA methyltransferase [Spirochaetales bacterium]|nr:TrmH family RNA methyltransferase [Spirochaetales bacterium]